MSLFTIVILVCSTATPRPACQPETALDVIHGPEVQNEMMCSFHGQAYLASTTMGRDIRKDEYVKIRCMRTGIGSTVG